MSRSVQAAQRRRAPPPDAGRPNYQPQQPPPQPSIRSSQLFDPRQQQPQQPRQPAYAQHQQQQQHQQQHQQHQQQQPRQPYAQQQQQPVEGIPTISKMTVPQAITLITLRLGSLESKLINMQSAALFGDDGMDKGGGGSLDSNMMATVMARLEALEQQQMHQQAMQQTAAVATPPAETKDIATLKSQFEFIKQAVIQNKNGLASEIKDMKQVKARLDDMTNDVNGIRDMIQMLQSTAEFDPNLDVSFDPQVDPQVDPTMGNNVSATSIGWQSQSINDQLANNNSTNISNNAIANVIENETVNMNDFSHLISIDEEST